MKNKTLKEIEKLTGYSKTTISRVLNQKADKYRISDAARIKILKAVQKTDYKPNFVAQILRNGYTRTIGLIVPFIKNPFFANLASIIISEANKYGYTVMLIDTQENSEMETNAIDTMLARKIDGIILVPCGDNPTMLEEVSETIPLILVDRYFENSSLQYVSTDNYTGAFLAMDLLLSSGHRKLLCIQGPKISMTTKERIRGCVDAIKKAEADVSFDVRGNDFTIQNGYIETKMALSGSDVPTAIFTLGNTILLGAIEALKEHNLNIPNDISIVSFDDNLYLDYLNPPITRVAQPISSIGLAAVKTLMQRINKKEETKSNLLIKPVVIKRDSVKIIL